MNKGHRSIIQVIKDWEKEHMVTMGTISQVRQGRSTKPATAYQIARAMGCSEVEAKAIADDADPEKDEKTA